MTNFNHTANTIHKMASEDVQLRCTAKQEVSKNIQTHLTETMCATAQDDRL